MRAPRALALLALPLLACQQRGATITFVLDTDLPLAAVHLLHFESSTVFDDGGVSELMPNDLLLGPNPGESCLPATFTAFARTRDYAGGLEVQLANGLLELGAPRPTLRRTVRLRFAPALNNGDPRIVRLQLTGACAAAAPASMLCPGDVRAPCTLSQACEALGQTCGNDGLCRAIELGASDFEPVPAGGVPAANCGTTGLMDAAVDRAEVSVTDARAPDAADADAARD